MHLFKTTALATAALLALSGGAVHAQSTSEIATLKNTVEDLRKQVQELRSLLQKQATPAAEPVAQEGESQESLDARTAASKADIQGLRTDLENYKYDQARTLERNVPSVVRNTRIGGSITLGYATQNPQTQPVTTGTTLSPSPAPTTGTTNSGAGATAPRSNTFLGPVIGLNFAGNLYRDYAEGRNLTYRLALNGTSTNGTTTIATTDAYIRYSFQPASGNPEDPLGTITLGQQIVPFGQDVQAIDPEVKAVIGNAGFVSGLGLSGRQTGAVVSGDYDPYVDFTNNYRAPLLAYALGVFNGNGANRNDNNDYRDIAARLVYTLPVDYASWLRQLQIGTSYYRGYESLISGSASGTIQNTEQSKGLNTRTGFDINWTHLPFSVSYEWAYGKKQLFAGNATNPDGYQRGVGQYVNFGYTWGEQFLNSSKQQGKFDDYWPKSYQAFVRFDEFDPNRSIKAVADKQFITTLGLNVFFAETTKFQINYLHTRNQLGGAAPTAAKPESINGWQAQLNATF